MRPPFTDLNLGFSNAENYRRRENKMLLDKYFVKDVILDKILDGNVFYLVGEKGTGKTAYATYLANHEHKHISASIYDVRQTEYQKFLELKRLGHLPLSQYSEVWRTLLLFVANVAILNNDSTPEFLQRFTKIAGVKKAVDEFYENAFAPEIVKMLSFVEEAEISSALLAKYQGIGTEVKGKVKSQASDNTSTFQTNLLKIRRSFETAITGLKLDSDILIFIDGIDVRPGDISYEDYFQCIRGLIEAVWAINNDFLANVKDLKKSIKVVLLVRPDTFQRTGLHNLNTKLRDNSVFMNWITSYKDYRGSLLFKIADRILASQQVDEPVLSGTAWDYYFPFSAKNIISSQEAGDKPNAFLAFLRFSYYRPRDITAMMVTIQDIIRRKRGTSEYVTEADFDDPSFRDAHAEYLLGEIRDQLLFYYSQDEYTLFLQFFLHLQGRRTFRYEEFTEAFNEFIGECAESGKVIPQFFETAPIFLQFLYELNVVCYKEREPDQEGKPFIRWCFRERTMSNMAPKVRLGVDYEIFYGLSKALNVGRPIRITRKATKKVIGTIILIDSSKGFGKIRGGAEQAEYYFKTVDLASEGDSFRLGAKVSFEVYVRYGRPRARRITREK